MNIAGFELDVIDKGSTALSMKVVVGRPYRRTPVFSSRITHVVLNPTWTAPETVVKEDVLPRVRKDIGYLERSHLRVFDGWGEDAREVDPATVNWSSVKPLRYCFRQDPGPWNALGRIKFLLPNSNDIYLHDTSERQLFSRASRVFSSGCVRLENPMALFDYLLQTEPRWQPETIEAVLEKRRGAIPQSRRSTARSPPLLDGLGRRGRDGPLPQRHLRARRPPGPSSSQAAAELSGGSWGR